MCVRERELDPDRYYVTAEILFYEKSPARNCWLPVFSFSLYPPDWNVLAGGRSCFCSSNAFVYKDELAKKGGQREAALLERPAWSEVINL